MHLAHNRSDKTKPGADLLLWKMDLFSDWPELYRISGSCKTHCERNLHYSFVIKNGPLLSVPVRPHNSETSHFYFSTIIDLQLLDCCWFYFLGLKKSWGSLFVGRSDQFPCWFAWLFVEGNHVKKYLLHAFVIGGREFKCSSTKVWESIRIRVHSFNWFSAAHKSRWCCILTFQDDRTSSWYSFPPLTLHLRHFHHSDYMKNVDLWFPRQHSAMKVAKFCWLTQKVRQTITRMHFFQARR